MKWLCFFLLIVAANTVHSEDAPVVHIKERIVGGTQTSINRLPYQAQLLRDGKQICGGTIISQRWILTAAHCIEQTVSRRTIITGSDAVSQGGQQHEIQKIIVHPDYDRNTNDNDIALIQLAANIQFNQNQQPIELAQKAPIAGEKVIVSGFGREGEYAGYSKFLKATIIPVIDHEICRSKYISDPITENMFCAGEGPTDACQGDSGGPAVVDGAVAGIVSAGMKCGDSYYPGIYTTVVNYRQWINDVSQQPKPALGPLGPLGPLGRLGPLGNLLAHKKYPPKLIGQSIGNLVNNVMGALF